MIDKYLNPTEIVRSLQKGSRSIQFHPTHPHHQSPCKECMNSHSKTLVHTTKST